MHAIIDSFSRRILAWRVEGSFDPGVTAVLLEAAANGLEKPPPNVFMDSGIENTNSTVTALVEKGTIARVLAQVEVVFSNSMIESWWRLLKHQWLYLNTLDSVEMVRKLVEFYVEQHNTHIPHSAFKGWQTPDEMYFGKGEELPEQLFAARLKAKQSRRAANLAVRCAACQTAQAIVPLEVTQTNSS
jgi:transposase InsO family protein